MVQATHTDGGACLEEIDAGQVLMASYITQRRIYDVMMRVLANINPKDAEILLELHTDGLFATPEPSMVVGDLTEETP